MELEISNESRLFGAWGGMGAKLEKAAAASPKAFEEVESQNLVIDGCGP